MISWVRDFLDAVTPLQSGSHADAVKYAVVDGRLQVTLADSTVTGSFTTPGCLPATEAMRARLQQSCFVITGCTSSS